MRPTLTVLLLLALPASAAAQTPTPTPPLPWDDVPQPWDFPPRSEDPHAAAWEIPGETPEEEEPALRAWEVFTPEPETGWRRYVRGPLGKPVIAPTIAIALGAHRVKGHDDLASSSFDVWFGGRVHPMFVSETLFFALGTEMNVRSNPRVEPRTSDDDRLYTEVVPELRYGFAFMRRPHDTFANTVLPNAEIYGITGWRIANGVEGHALRLGLGISAPIILRESVRAGTLAPSMVEITMDTSSAFSGERELGFRFGWHF